MSKLSIALAALVAVPLMTSSASADKALDAAKKNLAGSNANIVFGINVASITSSKLFQTMWPVMLQKGGQDMKDGLDLAQKECGMDPLKTITEVVVAMDKDSKKGVVYVSFAGGVDQAKLETCATKIGTAKKKPVPTFKKDSGNIIEVTSPEGKKEKKYYAWVDTGVIAMATEGDKASLTKWTGGKGFDAKSPIGAMFAKVSTAGAVWGVANVKNTIKPGVDMTGGYGSVGMTGGKLTVDMHAVMANDKMAASTATEAQTQLNAVTNAKGGGMPAGIVSALKSVVIKAAGPEVIVTAAMPEADVQMLLALAMTKL